MKIILIRHGESTGNKSNNSERKIYIGQYDCPLTDNGFQQALSLKDNPILNNVEAFYVSPLLRTRQTAQCFCNNMIIDERLKERSLGDFEGQQVEDIQNNKLYIPYFTDPTLINFSHDFIAKAPNGENYSDVENRVKNFLSDLIKMDYKKVVIVSHFCTIRCFIKIINKLSQQETMQLKVYPCQPIILEWKEY